MDTVNIADCAYLQTRRFLSWRRHSVALSSEFV